MCVLPLLIFALYHVTIINDSCDYDYIIGVINASCKALDLGVILGIFHPDRKLKILNFQKLQQQQKSTKVASKG